MTIRTLARLLARLSNARHGNQAADYRDALASAWTPGWLRKLGHTVAGDSFDTAYYWNGDLAGFTEQTVSGTATWTEGDNLVSALVNGQTSGDVSAQLIAATFSVGDTWVLPITGMLNVDGPSTNILAGGLIFTDGTATTSNCVLGHVQLPAPSAATSDTPILVGRHGTLTAATTAPWVSDGSVNWTPRILYIKLIYQAADTFRLQFSPDGITYSAFGEADISKTMTPTHVGLVAYQTQAADGIATFGPLLKVA